MQQNWQKKIFPHILAIVIFAVLGFVYCSPVLQGKVANMSDMTSVMGMTKEAHNYYDKTGKPQLWSNSMFSGMPTYLTFSGPSANKLAFLNNVFSLYLPQPVNMLFLAMLGFYFLLSVLGFKYWIRLIGAIAFGFSSFNVIMISAGHITEMMSLNYMAPVLAGIILTYRGRYFIGGIITALAAGMMIYNNHLQIVYYTLIVAACLAIAAFIHSLREKNIPQFFIASAILIIAGILAVLPASDNLLITQEYTHYSMRGSQSELTLAKKNNIEGKKGGLDIDYAYQWSYGKLETFTMLIPDMFGGASGPLPADGHTYDALTNLGLPPQQATMATQQFSSYWGEQPFTSGPVYFGAIVCFLFVLSLFVIKSWHKWWLVGVSVIAIILSWGQNFPAINDFLFYHLPLYNKFRSPTMALIIPQVTFVLAACWGLNDIVQEKINKQQLWDYTKKAFYITGGLILVLTFIVGGMLDYSSATDSQLRQQLVTAFGNNANAAQTVMNAIHADRASLLHSDGIRSFFFVLVAFGALWAYLKNKLKVVPTMTIIGLAILIDLFPVDKRYLNTDNFVQDEDYKNTFQASQADQLILQDKTPYFRTLNLAINTFNDASTSYFHKSIGGYSPAKLWRYQDLIDYQIQPAINKIKAGLQGAKTLDSATMNLFTNSPILNLLNTKYFIVNPQGAPVENPNALGNAWFINNIHWAPNADSEILDLNNINPANTVVIDQRFKQQLKGFQPSTDNNVNIKLTKYGLNELDYTSDNVQKGLGVFSDIYYPAGWKAYIDGKETDILRVDYALRGLIIPAGKHEIVFKFHPKTYFLGQDISGISSIFLIILVLAGIAYSLYKENFLKRKKE